MNKLETENELNLQILDKAKNELVNEECCTVLTISLNNKGDVYTTFLGAYNKEVLKLLEKSQRVYYKGLMKKLKSKTIEDMASDNVNLELNKPLKKQHEQKPKKGKKVDKKLTSTVNVDKMVEDDKTVQDDKKE